MTFARRRTYSASAGSAMGPPWHSTMTSSRTARAAAAHSSIEPDAVVERLGRLGADAATGGEPHVADDDVGTCLGHRHGVVGAEHVRRGEQVEVAGGGDHLDLQPVAHARLLEVLAEHAVDQPDRREVLHAGEAEVAELAEEGVAAGRTDRCR